MQNRKLVNPSGRAGTNFVAVDSETMAVETLNELISANRGMINVHQTALGRLDNETNQSMLQDTIERHKTFLTELSNSVVTLGGTPDTGSTTSSLAKQAWVTLKSAVTSGDGPILAEDAQDAETVLDTYAEAMSSDLPEDVRDLIGRQMSETRLVSERLSALSTAYGYKS